MPKNTSTYLLKPFALLLSALLMSCQTSQPQTAENKDTMAAEAMGEVTNQQQNQTAISDQEMLDSLVPQISIEQPKISQQRFDVSVKNVDMRSFLLGLVDSTPFNMVISPDVKGKASLQLKDVTINEVLMAVERIYPVMIEKQANVFYVSSAESMTAIYPVDYLNLTREGKSRTNIAGQTVTSGQQQNNSGGQGGNSSGASSSSVNQLNSTEIKTESKVDFWGELQNSLNLIVAGEEKSQVIVSPHSGIVIVKALPKTQRLIRDYLGVTQQNLNRHVILEAKIIEVVLNEGFQSGIDWQKMNTLNGGSDSLLIGQQGQVLNTQQSSTPLNGILSLLYQSNSFQGAIDLLKSQGNVQVLSSPRISTINNQKAVIKVGSDEFFVTDVSTTTVTGTSTATTPDVTLTPFFSGISLDVTPQINQNNDIILHIHPVVSEVSDQQKTFTLGQDQFSLPLALTNIRESDSIIRAKDQQVIVIGGLMQNKISQTENSTPLLGDIPIVGSLFKQTRDSVVKSELVILLKAKLVDAQSNQLEFNNIKSRLNQM
jgi:MSHA biogenesis protein MshL